MRNNANQPTQAEKDAARKMRRLNQPIPEEVHRALKSYAALNGKRIPEALEELLRKVLDVKDPPQSCVAA